MNEIKRSLASNGAGTLDDVLAGLRGSIGAMLRTEDVRVVMSLARSRGQKPLPWAAELAGQLEAGDCLLISALPNSKHDGSRGPAERHLAVPVIGDQLEAVVWVRIPEGTPLPGPDQLNCLRQVTSRVAPQIKRLRDCGAASSNFAEELERLAQSHAELAAVVEIKSHVIANLVHDFRSPMVAIRGYVKMLLEERAGPLTATQREYLTIVSENTNRAVNLVSNLMRFTTSEQLRLASFDLRELWRESLRRARAGAAERFVEIREKVPDEPIVIMGDREKLGQVFDGLLWNAVKFTDRGGEITAEFSRGDENEVVVRISDTGVGIPPGLLDKVFDRCCEAETSAQADPGAGPGLALVHDIIRLHGGRISVTSKAGEGSTFVFELPAIHGATYQEDLTSYDQASSSRSGR